MANIINTTTNYVNGTGSADLIYNYVPAYVHGKEGNDQIASISQVAFINGDDGADGIANYAFNAQVYLDGGDDNDYIINYGGGIATLYGGYDVDDYYKDNDILVGSPYAVDFFVVGEYCGYDIIQNYESNDAIFCATTSGYPPYAYSYGSDVIVEGYGMQVLVQGAAYKQFNFGYMGSYNNPSFDTASDDLWGGANTFTGTAQADNIYIGKSGGNDLIFDAGQEDTIRLCDVTLSDIVGTAVSDNAVAIAFNTGETAVVATNGNVSAKFQLATGESYAYNRESGAWQQA